MKILICSFTTPGYAPNELAEYLTSETGHQVRLVQCPAKHERRFIPGWSHYQNFRQIINPVIEEIANGGEHFDIAIGPDPIFALACISLQKQGLVGRSIYWRLDYYPSFKYLNFVYQILEQTVRKKVDTIWSISDPSLSHVKRSLSGTLTKTIHVPYLMHKRQMSRRVDITTRRNACLWMGPDLDGSRELCTAACLSLGMKLYIADYSNPKLRVSQETLDLYLRECSIGLSPYSPEPKSPKYYADVSRIRRFLAHGMPVVTTSVTPTSKTIVDYNAGSICDWTADSIADSIQDCRANFEEMSNNAYDAAQHYTYEDWFGSRTLLHL